MSDRKRFFRSGARALAGIVITAIAAIGALFIGTVQLPDVEREPHALTVSTTQAGERSVVCTGAFAELGADPKRPDIAVPVGEAGVLVHGDGALSTLEASPADGVPASGARVLTAPVDTPIAAAQSQRVDSATLFGTTASSCVEPVNEQWLVGGATTLGLSTTLSLGNASAVPATVQISVFDENGEIDALFTAGVIVAPNSEQTVSLNGYAPNRERLAVRVTSTGAPVSASLGVAMVDGIEPVGAGAVTRQLRPERQLVIPGVANEDNHDHEEVPTDSGPNDRFPVTVHVITPGTKEGVAAVSAIDAAGKRTELGTIELSPSEVGRLTVPLWPHDATALLIDADVPVFAGAQGSANTESAHDFDWFSPAPEIAAGVTTPAPVVGGGTLVIANTGERDAEVTIEGEKATTVKVPAGTAVTAKAEGSLTLTSTEPVHAGVRVVGNASIAGYPIQPRAERANDLTVYTR